MADLRLFGNEGGNLSSEKINIDAVDPQEFLLRRLVRGYLFISFIFFRIEYMPIRNQKYIKTIYYIYCVAWNRR